MIRLLLFALLFAMPAAADNVFMDNTTSESNMCVIGITGQTTSNPAAVARATYSPITYTCSPGTYLPADGIECVTCTRYNYCPGGNYTYNPTITQGLNPCPDPNTHKRTTFPAEYNNPTIFETGWYSGSPTGASLVSQCRAYSWMSNTIGKFYEIVSYNTTTEKYDIYGSSAWGDVNPGYYLTNKAGCGSLAYYHDALPCPAGSYCPGKEQVACNSSNESTVHTTNFGLESCPSGTYTDTTGQSSCTACANGYYQDETGQTSCKSCPDQTTHVRTTFDTVTYTNNGKSVTITYDGTPSIIRKNADYTLGDKTSVDQCAVSESIQTSKGIIYEIDRYNTTTEQYDTLNYLYGWLGAEPGYYLTNKDTDLAGGGCATQGFYAEIKSCPAGSYCPGVTQSSNPPCNSNPTTYWPENRGLYTCPANNFCPANSSSATPCDTGYSSNAGASSCTPNTITIDWSGYGAGNNQTQSTQCTYGGSITTPTEAPTKRGHVFVGWTFDLN